MPAKTPQPPIKHGPTKEEWRQAHEAMKVDRQLWRSLTLDGIQSNGRGGLIEQRRCPACGRDESLDCDARAPLLSAALRCA